MHSVYVLSFSVYSRTFVKIDSGANPEGFQRVSLAHSHSFIQSYSFIDSLALSPFHSTSFLFLSLSNSLSPIHSLTFTQMLSLTQILSLTFTQPLAHYIAS